MEEEFDSEMLDLAIAREMGAYYFYMRLSERQTDTVVADIFKSLADEELEHKAKLEFEIIKRGRVVNEDSEGRSRFEGIYPPIEVEEAFNVSYKKALEIAIKKEDMSFRFYADMAARVTDEQTLNVLYSLAEEEESHKQKCVAQYNALIEWGG
jgi:rubrerythrin